jgi:TolB-like protein
MTGTATKAVFLSHASQDQAAAARICEALGAAGLDVWFDQSELRGGDAWDKAIRRQIRDCALFVALISANTDARSEAYFRLEWKLAVDRSHLMADDQPFLLPVVIDDTSEATARVPDCFRERQWIRLPGGATSPAFVDRVRRLLSGDPAATTQPAPVQRPSARVDADAECRIAVLPFKCRGNAVDTGILSEGLSEEIVTGLARFSYLRVITHSSTQRIAGQAMSVADAGQALGARYVMDGSIRQAGSMLRIAAQLVDTRSGAHLWAETYDRTFQPEDVFALVDDVVPRIVSSVADMHGVLPHAMSEILRNRDPDGLSAYETVLRSFGYVARLTAEEHALVRDCVERALAREPDNADVLAMASFVYAEEYKHGFNVRAGSLDRALDAAQRAVAAAPTSHLGFHVLAQAHFFRREIEAFRSAAERAIALNPMDGCTTAFMGILMAYAGDWARGCALAGHAMQLNPRHPGWYRFSAFFNAYRQGAYRDALGVAMQMNLPSYFYTHTAIAAAAAQLGEHETARKAVRDLLALKPDFTSIARQEYGKWLGHGELLEHVLDGLRKAGLEIG